MENLAQPMAVYQSGLLGKKPLEAPSSRQNYGDAVRSQHNEFAA